MLHRSVAPFCCIHGCRMKNVSSMRALRWSMICILTVGSSPIGFAKRISYSCYNSLNKHNPFWGPICNLQFINAFHWQKHNRDWKRTSATWAQGKYCWWQIRRKSRSIVERIEILMNKLKICVAGATGWAGSELSKGIFRAEDMELVAAVSRSNAGKTLGEVINVNGLTAPIFGTVEDALKTNPDVLVEYTKRDAAKHHVLSALKSGTHVVIGTSGLTNEDYEEIDQTAKEVNRGVLAAGNFALTAVLLQKFAEMAAKYIPEWEVIDYAHADKKDVPSGTAREMANRLSKIQESKLEVPLEQIEGTKETRGARLQGTQVHSIRLPGYMISIDAIFGMPDQKLILRHESGSSAEPYVQGALLAIREVSKLTGLHRGLDSVMKF